MKPIIYFLLNSINVQRGGLTRASLKQASFFAELGFETHIVTFHFNTKYSLIRKQLLEMKKVHKNVFIHNMYEDLSGDKPSLPDDNPAKRFNLEDYTEGLPYEKRYGRQAYRVYNNGTYYKYINLNEVGTVHYIDYYDENRYRTKRVEYDVTGNVTKVAFMDLTFNSPRQIVYYNKKGNAYFTQWNNPETNEIQRIILFHDDLSVKKHYIKNDAAPKIDWLKGIIDQNKKKSVIISDTRSTDAVLVGLNHPNAAKVWRLHSNHVTQPYTVDADISRAVKTGYDNIQKFDLVAVLTERQKQDLVERTSLDKSHFTVVPHYHEEKTNKLKAFFTRTKPDEKLGVIVSRLSSLKQIKDSIQAFQLVVKEIPDARLEIWGTGKEEKKLKQLISKLKLTKNIFLKGYTHHPNDAYKKGLFSLLTSKTEGFALSILESMYNETPVISYDVRYGPRDMIVDNTNGFLVNNKDIEALASKMIWMFENPKKAITMGKRAKQHIDKNFSKDIYKEKWLQAIDIALQSKFGSGL